MNATHDRVHAKHLPKIQLLDHDQVTAITNADQKQILESLDQTADMPKQVQYYPAILNLDEIA